MCNEYIQKLTAATANRERTEIVVARNWTEMADALEFNEVVVMCSSKTTVVPYSETAVVLCSETAVVSPNEALLQRSVSHIHSYSVLLV